MARIYVNITSAREVNSKLPSIKRRVSDAKNNISRMKYSIDPKILARNNLRTRLNHSYNDIAYIENHLQVLYAGVSRYLEQYSAVEDDIKARAFAGNLGSERQTGEVSNNISEFLNDVTIIDYLKRIIGIDNTGSSFSIIFTLLQLLFRSISQGGTGSANNTSETESRNFFQNFEYLGSLYDLVSGDASVDKGLDIMEMVLKIGDFGDLKGAGVTGDIVGFINSYIEAIQDPNAKNILGAISDGVSAAGNIKIGGSEVIPSWQWGMIISMYASAGGTAIDRYTELNADGSISWNDVASIGIHSSLSGLNECLWVFKFSDDAVRDFAMGVEDFATSWGTSAGNMVNNNPFLKKMHDSGPIGKFTSLIIAIGAVPNSEFLEKSKIKGLGLQTKLSDIASSINSLCQL